MTARKKISEWLIKHPEVNPYKFSINNSLRKFSSGNRMLPSFLIIGAAKSGTTSLYANLIEHPNILPSSKKEISFFQFMQDTRVSFYKEHFPLKKKNFITGEASASYLPHKFIPKRVYDLIPNVKLITILRDPVERAYSSFFHKLRLGEQIIDDFEDTIDAEFRRMELEETKPELVLNNLNYDHPSFSYLKHGLYAEHLENWYKYFQKDQILILDTKEFQKFPDQVMQKTFSFLNIEKFEIKKLDPTKMKKLYSMNDERISENNKTESMNKTKLNVQTYPEMKSETRKRLQEFFKPHNEKLFSLIGKRFNWNDE